MRFTDRFIQVPIKVYSVREKNLTGKEICNDSFEKLNPLQIESYRPTFDEDYEGDCVYVSYKSGNPGLTVYLSIDEFETLLNVWHEMTSNSQ
jgi:hypothetical protein